MKKMELNQMETINGGGWWNTPLTASDWAVLL